MWLNLLNATDKSSIYSCSYIAVHVYIRVLCAYLTITFCFRNDIWQLRSFDFRKPCFHMYFMSECQNHCISKLHTYWVEKNILILPHKGKQHVTKNYLQEKITIRFDISASTTSSTNKTIKATRGSGIPAPGSAGTR